VFLQHAAEAVNMPGGVCMYHMLIIRKLVITPFCVNNKLENIVISLLIPSTWRMITRNQLIILLDQENKQRQSLPAISLP
jgi:hypothetical protein